MEAVGSTRLGRATSRYGAPAVFSGPVRKWKKKWVHVTPSSFNNNTSQAHNNNNNNNNKPSSRLLLRRWTPITAPSVAAADVPQSGSDDVADEPPRRKFRYTPIAVLEEQKKVVVEKSEHEPTSESDKFTAKQINATQEVHGKLNMNEISEESKDSSISKLDLGLDLQGNNGENSLNNDMIRWEKII